MILCKKKKDSSFRVLSALGNNSGMGYFKSLDGKSLVLLHHSNVMLDVSAIFILI